jgi:hypothetical protein
MRAGSAAFREELAEGRASTYEPTAAERAAVKKVWSSAKRRITEMVRIRANASIELVLAEPARSGDERTDASVAFEALVRSCAPFTVTVGLQDPANPFYEGWAEFCRWALSEQLIPEVWLEHDRRFMRCEIHGRVRHFPVAP